MSQNLFAKKNKDAIGEQNSKTHDLPILHSKFDIQMQSLTKRMQATYIATISGVVMIGQKQDAKYLFPTADLLFSEKNIQVGGYFSTILINFGNTKVFYPAISFVLKEKIVKTYIPNFSKNIYGYQAEIKLVEYVPNLVYDIEKAEQIKQELPQYIEKLNTAIKNSGTSLTI